MLDGNPRAGAKNSMRFLCLAALFFVFPLLAWEGKVFDVSGKKVTIASSQTSGVRTGTRLYILKDGKEVGQGRVGSVFHTKVEMTLKGGNAEIVKLLLNAGANANTNSKEGETALGIASRSNNPGVLELLKAAGAKA